MLVAKRYTLALGMIIAVSVTGCASLGMFQTPEERVEQRAQERLDALMSRDLQEVFSFVAPALRETTTWQRYGAGYAGAVNWREATVKSVVCELDRCEVKISVRYQMVRPKLVNTRSLTEVWIEVGNQWYIYDK